MTGTATATLTELVPASGHRRASLVATAANMGGLGLGPLVAGLFAQYAPRPHDAGVRGLPGGPGRCGRVPAVRPRNGQPAHRPALRFAGLGIPERGRGKFIAAAVAGFAAFALLGLFSSLVPGFIGGVLHQGSHAVQGAVVFGMFAVGTVTPGRAVPVPQPPGRAGRPGPVPGRAGPDRRRPGPGRDGPVPGRDGSGGVAVGAIFLGSLATANRLAPAEWRGHAVSAFFVACYAGLIIPVVGVGVLSGSPGPSRPCSPSRSCSPPCACSPGQDRHGPRVGHGGEPMTGERRDRAAQPASGYQIRVRGHLGTTSAPRSPPCRRRRRPRHGADAAPCRTRPRCTACWPRSRRSGWNCSRSAGSPGRGRPPITRAGRLGLS